MAHIEKFAKSSVGHLFAHFERKKIDGEFIKFSNQEIDTTKTDQNYNIAWNKKKTQYKIYKDRLSQVQVFNRKDVKTLCSCVTTIPQDTYLKFKDNPKAIREFFEHSYNFLENRYGKQNVVSSFVHMDETTPHMHFAFIPVVLDKKKNIEKVCAKEVITKTELQTFHKDYQEYLNNNLSYECLVHTGITKENKTIKELKDDTIRDYFVSQKNTPILKDKQKNDVNTEKIKFKKIPFFGEMVEKSDYDKLLEKYKSKKQKIKDLRIELEKATETIKEMKNSSKNIKISRLRQDYNAIVFENAKKDETIREISKEKSEMYSKNYKLKKENQNLISTCKKLESSKDNLDIEIYKLWQNDEISDKVYNKLLDNGVVDFPEYYHKRLEYSLDDGLSL